MVYWIGLNYIKHFIFEWKLTSTAGLETNAKCTLASGIMYAF